MEDEPRGSERIDRSPGDAERRYTQSNEQVSQRLRKAGPPCLHTGDHAALEYATEGELVAAIVPYLLEGLRLRDKVVYVADDLAPEAIRGALARAGVDVFEQERAGRLAVTTARDAFFGVRRFNPDSALAGMRVLGERAAREGFHRVRLGVEMTYLSADVPGIERGAQFESRANNEIFGRMPFVCLCAFNRSRQSADVLDEVRRSHPILVVGDRRTANPSYRPWSELEPPSRDERRPLASTYPRASARAGAAGSR